MNKPIKPFSVAREDFYNNLLTLINESGLPPAVIQPILSDFQQMVVNAAREQYEKERAQYKSEMEKYEKAVSAMKQSEDSVEK